MAGEPRSMAAKLRDSREEVAATRQSKGKQPVRKTEMTTDARRDQETPGLFVTPAPGSSRRESIQPDQHEDIRPSTENPAKRRKTSQNVTADPLRQQAPGTGSDRSATQSLRHGQPGQDAVRSAQPAATVGETMRRPIPGPLGPRASGSLFGRSIAPTPNGSDRGSDANAVPQPSQPRSRADILSINDDDEGDDDDLVITAVEYSLPKIREKGAEAALLKTVQGLAFNTFARHSKFAEMFISEDGKIMQSRLSGIARDITKVKNFQGFVVLYRRTALKALSDMDDMLEKDLAILRKSLKASHLSSWSSQHRQSIGIHERQTTQLQDDLTWWENLMDDLKLLPKTVREPKAA